MNDFTIAVVTAVQMLAVIAILLCGAEAMLTEFQAKRLIRQRFNGNQRRSKSLR